MEAQCQCGKVQFTTPADKPIIVYVCHCLECRRQSASAFGMSAAFEAFELPEAAREHITVYERLCQSGRTAQCLFCTHCGTRLIHDRGAGAVTVKAGCLSGLTREMVDGATHIWTKRAVVPIPEGNESFEEEPDEEHDNRVFG